MTTRSETATETCGEVLRHDRDSDLAYRHRAGDPSAFEEVFTTHQGMIYNLALRFCDDPIRAEDLAQEALLKIARNLGSFQGRSSLKTWIYRVAMNCFRSSVRRRELETRSIDNVDRVLELPDQGLSPESKTYGVELRARINAALAQLPTRFREAVILRDIEGLSYQEIGEVCGCRLGTVRSRIARGREALRRALEEDMGPEENAGLKKDQAKESRPS